jgi:hypothetical protein
MDLKITVNRRHVTQAAGFVVATACAGVVTQHLWIALPIGLFVYVAVYLVGLVRGRQSALVQSAASVAKTTRTPMESSSKHSLMKPQPERDEGGRSRKRPSPMTIQARVAIIVVCASIALIALIFGIHELYDIKLFHWIHEQYQANPFATVAIPLLAIFALSWPALLFIREGWLLPVCFTVGSVALIGLLSDFIAWSENHGYLNWAAAFSDIYARHSLIATCFVVIVVDIIPWVVFVRHRLKAQRSEWTSWKKRWSVLALVLAVSGLEAAFGLAIVAALSTVWFPKSFYGHPWFWTAPLLIIAATFMLLTMLTIVRFYKGATVFSSVAASLALVTDVLWAIQVSNNFARIYLWLACVVIIGLWGTTIFEDVTSDYWIHMSNAYWIHLIPWIVTLLAVLVFLVTGGVELFS